MAALDYTKDTFGYFKALHPSIAGGTVLDYGSNYGTFLDSAGAQFPQKNYCGIDVDPIAIAEGSKRFPDATFIAYGGYNSMYNNRGSNIRPQLDQQYDTIVSYSVLTHTSLEDMRLTIEWLYQLLKPRGKMLLTWLDVDEAKTMMFFEQKRTRAFGYCDPLITDSYAYLNDNKISNVIDPAANYVLLLFKKEFLAEVLQQYKYTLAPVPWINGRPQFAGCIQSCAVIEKQ